MIWKTGLAAALQLFAAAQIFPQNVEIQPIVARRKIPGPAPSPTIRANSSLVLVPVHVTNRAGVSINGLEPGVFTVLENKAAQPIASFGNEDQPCSIGVILDLSGSMSARHRLAAEALHSFLETANPADEAFLLAVSTKPQKIADFTSDFGALQNRLLESQTGGATALVDTIYEGIKMMRNARHAQRALLVVSDGMDNHSRYSSPELLRVLDEADVQVYTIAIESTAVLKKAGELIEERNGLNFLQALADRSGGLNRLINDFNEAPSAAEKLSRAIREQYLIGYRPSGQGDGRWRAIQVKVDLQKVRVSARTGYYAR